MWKTGMRARIQSVLRFFSVCIIALFAFAVVSTVSALAQPGSFPTPSADIGQILDQIMSGKVVGFFAAMQTATLLTVQAIKYWVKDNWKYKRLSILIVAIAYSVASEFIVPSANIGSVLIKVFITMGGAMALFETGKGAGIFESKKKA